MTPEMLRDALRQIAEYDAGAFDHVDEWAEAAAFVRCQEIARAALAADAVTP